MNTPKTTWVQPKLPEGEYKFIPKPAKPKHGRGNTKFDSHFDRMLKEDLAIVIPSDDVSAIKKAFQRYERNRKIKGKFSFRQAMNGATKTHTIWMESRSAKEE